MLRALLSEATRVKTG